MTMTKRHQKLRNGNEKNNNKKDKKSDEITKNLKK